MRADDAEVVVGEGGAAGEAQRRAPVVGGEVLEEEAFLVEWKERGGKDKLEGLFDCGD